MGSNGEGTSPTSGRSGRPHFAFACRRGQGRKRNRHEHALARGSLLSRLASQLPPRMDHLGVDAPRHRHLGHRGTGRLALGKYVM